MILKPCFADNVERNWLPDIRKVGTKVPFILVGNKKDLREETDGKKPLVTAEGGREKATKVGALDYMECSAKTGEGVTEIFEAATR